MQVVTPDQDHPRDRASHSQEVKQIAQRVAKRMRLNPDLAGALSLVHDIGHPPFAHGGESALQTQMNKLGHSFEHNKHGLRVVEFIEKKYPHFRGLNLSIETLEGMKKHDQGFQLGPKKVYWPHLELQLVDICDKIAYLTGDLEDALDHDYIKISELENIDICKIVIDDLKPVQDNFEHHKEYRSAIIQGILTLLTERLISDFKYNQKKHEINTQAEAQNCKERLVGFAQKEGEPENFGVKIKQLKTFLMDKYYKSEKVKKQDKMGEEMVHRVFEILYKSPQKIPNDFFPNMDPRFRVRDYIAGMTDRFLKKTYETIK